MTEILLNKDLDIEALSREYRERQRIRIPNVFRKDAAERIHACLCNEVPWRLSFHDKTRPEGEREVVLTREEFSAMSPADRAALHQRVYQEAAEGGFQYLYNSYMLIDAWLRDLDPHLYIHKVLAYLGTDHFIEFAKRVTGKTDIDRVDAHATRYVRGHFLKAHNDPHPTQVRRVAYVLSFTPVWQIDWGGLLHFIDDDDRVVETFVPNFNSLTLFTVPIMHSVSCVTPYATAERLSITGWLIV